ncbi:tRNA endonuclease ANKZF1 [Aplochiton taeniatus]
MVCSSCNCSFESREEQIEHYKLDWHRFNLRQKIVGLPSVSVEEFERKTGVGDMSSISGSDSDSESEKEDSDSDWAVKSSGITPAESCSSAEVESACSRCPSKVLFQNSEGQYIAVYRCALESKPGDTVASFHAISNKAVWVILMTGGGHFAGAVFQGKEVLQHKTFHRYTVRAKRGTAQGLRDSQNRSHVPKSAGAALRRHNEAALVKEIQDLLESWAEHLKEASAIFLRASSYNKTVFFGGRAAPLERKDPRLRSFPFATRRATFRELQRAHGVLSTVHVYGKDTDISDIFTPTKKEWKRRTAKTQPETNSTQNTSVEIVEDAGGTSEEEDCVLQLETVEVTLSTLDLREHELLPSRQRKKRRRKKESTKEKEEKTGLRPFSVVDEVQLSETELAEDGPVKPTKGTVRRRAHTQERTSQPEEEENDSWEYGLRDALYTACKVGDVDTLQRLLQEGERQAGDKDGGATVPGSCPSSTSPAPGGVSPLALLNKPIDTSGFTLLHVASAAGQRGAVKLLMDAGGNPSCSDKKGQTPYIVAPEKDTRNMFRKYMAENPDKYDYIKAQVPAPLTAELELKKMQKKKAQKAAKKQREKEQKEERKKQELEEGERKRFASLSDREKRALAAEKRFAEQKTTTGANLSNTNRCWQCGESLLGKVPFHYLDFTFCTPCCVQLHRKAKEPAAKT